MVSARSTLTSLTSVSAAFGSPEESTVHHATAHPGIAPLNPYLSNNLEINVRVCSAYSVRNE